MAVPIKMLRLSKGMEVGRVITWLKHAGDAVSKGEPVVEVETEKSVVELEAIGGGVVLELLIDEDEEIPVGTVLGWIGQPGETPKAGDAVTEEASEPTPEAEELAPAMATPAPARKGPVRAAPALRRLANEHGIDLQAVAGTGPGGRVTKGDMDAAIAAKSAVPASAPAEQGAAERVPLKGVRRIMAERMAHSAHTTAAATTVVDVDMGEIAELKNTQPLTYTAGVVKAMASALRQYRILNASLEGDQIVLYKAVNIGVAVDGKHGLTVVTIDRVDAKPLAGVDSQLRELARQAKEGGLKLDTMESPTFTVTNSGVLGSLMFTPIINPPQSATLGMGKVQDTPVVRSGGIAIRPVMYLCLTYDHRIVQGAEAVGALQVVKQHLEDPTLMA
jgi:2-oxoglutarate dehydrogenase E2 component (dihydrolipoamide succinyltransferase)